MSVKNDICVILKLKRCCMISARLKVRDCMRKLLFYIRDCIKKVLFKVQHFSCSRTFNRIFLMQSECKPLFSSKYQQQQK